MIASSETPHGVQVAIIIGALALSRCAYNVFFKTPKTGLLDMCKAQMWGLLRSSLSVR